MGGLGEENRGSAVLKFTYDPGGHQSECPK
jgi:hypothetical protein